MDPIYAIITAVALICNVLLVLYVYIDRFVFMRTAQNRLLTELFNRELQVFSQQLGTLIEDIEKRESGALAAVQKSDADLSIMLQTHLQELFESQKNEISMIINSLKASISNLSVEAENETKNYIAHTQGNLNKFQEEYASVMKDAINKLLDAQKLELNNFMEEEKTQIRSVVSQERDRARKILQENILRQTQLVVSKVIRDGLSIPDHEKLVLKELDRINNLQNAEL